MAACQLKPVLVLRSYHRAVARHWEGDNNVLLGKHAAWELSPPWPGSCTSCLHLYAQQVWTMLGGPSQGCGPHTDSLDGPSSPLNPPQSLQADLEHGRVRTSALDSPNPRTTHSGIYSSKCNQYQHSYFLEGPPEMCSQQWSARVPAFALAWHPTCSTGVAYVAIAAKSGDCHIAMKPAL